MKIFNKQAREIFLALILGCIVGLILNKLSSNFLLLDQILNLIGQLFINLIKLMVVPLVFVSIVLGVASIGNLEKLGRIGSKIICFYLGTTAFAVSSAIFFAKIINLNSDFNINYDYNIKLNNNLDKKNIFQTIIDIIPENPIKALVSGNMIQIIFFAILIGIGITLLEKEKKNIITSIFDSLNEINLKLVNLIMNLAPIGVFALISYTFSNFGWKIIFSLSKFLLLNYFVFAFHALITYSIMFKILTKLSIKKLWHKFLPTASVAFSTASSSATLPVAIKAANNLGVSNEISAFGLSLGSTINMNGTAIMQGITTIFLSHIYKIDLNTTDLIKIIAVSVISAIGTAGVPGAGILMLSMVLKTANIPVEGIGLIIGVDRIIDAGRTLVNVMGDVICTVIVAKLENDLDEKKFNN